jgi:glyoxylase-like metal-dependent hydrolase (beta-lactamase superfamily II)
MSFQIADRWFEFETIGDGITRIWEPHVIPLMQCNIWHVRGRDRDILVDTGMGVASLSDAAKHLFDKALSAVATHSHLDHVGSLYEFPDRIIHRAEAELVAHEDDSASLNAADYPPAQLDGYRRAGYHVEDCYVTAIPHHGYNLAEFSLKAAPATRLVDEGDIIDLGDRHFEVLHLPGHSPGSIGLWEASAGILFSGDAIYDGPLLDEGGDSDIPAYIATMHRLASLPARVIHGGHDPSFDGARLKVLARAYLDRREA